MSIDIFCDAARVWSPLFEAASTAIVSAGVFCNKVYLFAVNYFKAGSSCFFVGQATYDICLGTKQKEAGITEEKTDKKAKEALYILPKKYYCTHGALLAGAGICGGLEALNAFSYISLGKFLSTVKAAGSLFLIYANFVALEQNITFYEEASQALKECLEKDKKELQWKQQSAVWGIASNLGCILTLALTLFGWGPALALVIGVISSCTGALKSLFDFLLWTKQVGKG